MFRVLLCMSCCGVPPTNHSRQTRSRVNTPSTNDLKNVKQGGIKDQEDTVAATNKSKLLINQVQVNNESLADGKSTVKEGKILSREVDLGSGEFGSEHGESVPFKASTSTPISNNLASDNLNRRSSSDKMAAFAEQSISAASSIDIEQFSERPTLQLDPNESYKTARPNQEGDESERWFSAAQIDTQTSMDLPSTTKIGDYARIEYSPVEDLESVTTASRGPASERAISERQYSTLDSTRSSLKSALKNPTSQPGQGEQQPAPVPANDEKPEEGQRTGMESSSISIASQLSTELQQSLTNILETANSPVPRYGEIGLPLGPPLESSNTYPETRKTSPETFGPALTSPDSLSEKSMPRNYPSSRTGTLGSTTTNGAALVSDGEELGGVSQTFYNSTKESETSTEVSQLTSTSASVTNSNRIGSPISQATTLSANTTVTTNPTPTPSEMSGSTSSKRKRRLNAGKLLRKLRPGKSKKSKGENEIIV